MKSEYVAATDKIQKLQNEIHRIEAEKRDNLNKIQNMHTEMKDLRKTNAGEFGEQSKHFSVLKKNKYSLLIFSVS